MNPGGDAGWDGPPLDVQIPDDARELERDVLAYHREQRAIKRRRRLRRIMPAQAGVMPLIASILAVCLVAGMMLSVFTISPADGTHVTKPRTPASQPARPSPQISSALRPSGRAAGTQASSTLASSPQASGTPAASQQVSGTQASSPQASSPQASGIRGS